jgi:hypothetical protein
MSQKENLEVHAEAKGSTGSQDAMEFLKSSLRMGEVVEYALAIHMVKQAGLIGKFLDAGRTDVHISGKSKDP